MSNHQLRNSSSVRRADDPSTVGAHHLGLVGDRRHRDCRRPRAGAGTAAHSVSPNPDDAPSFRAMKRIGEDFKETRSAGAAMVVLEGQQPLGDDAHHYYDRLVRQLKDDPKACAARPRFLGGSPDGGRSAKRRW